MPSGEVDFKAAIMARDVVIPQAKQVFEVLDSDPVEAFNRVVLLTKALAPVLKKAEPDFPKPTKDEKKMAAHDERVRNDTDTRVIWRVLYLAIENYSKSKVLNEKDAKKMKEKLAPGSRERESSDFKKFVGEIGAIAWAAVEAIYMTALRLNNHQKFSASKLPKEHHAKLTTPSQHIELLENDITSLLQSSGR